MKFYENWQIYSIVFIIQLKSILNKNDFYEKKIKKFDSIEIQKRISNSDIYEIEKIIVKKRVYINRDFNKKFHDEWKIKYLKWENYCKKWKIIKNLQCFDLLKEFKEQKVIENENIIIVYKNSFCRRQR